MLRSLNITHQDGGDECSVDGCREPFHCHGFCYKHYVRWKRHGDPNLSKHEVKKNYLLNVVLKHDKKRDCLIWPFSAKAGAGYPVIHLGNMQHYVHRLVCEQVHGTPPTPFHQVAHSCGNGHLGCVNPHHLRWATAKENAQDMLRHGTGRNQFGSF